MTNYNDGKWHGWNGGECPVHPESMVEALWPSIIQDGKNFRSTRKACDFTWIVSNNCAPFLFRVVKEHREPREWWAVGKRLHDTEEDAIAFRKFCADIDGADHLETPIIHVREVLE